MKKVIVKLDVQDDKSKQKAMSTVSSLSGVNSISMDMKEKKLTVTGDVDPVVIVSKLRKICHTVIVSVGPEKEEKKPADQPKKDQEPKKEDPKKAAEEKKKEEQRLAEFIKACQAYNLYCNPQFYSPRCISIEEDPNACVIS